MSANMQVPLLGRGPEGVELEAFLTSINRQIQGLQATAQAKQKLVMLKRKLVEAKFDLLHIEPEPDSAFSIEQQMAEAECIILEEEIWACQQGIKQQEAVRDRVMAGALTPQAGLPPGVTLR